MEKIMVTQDMKMEVIKYFGYETYEEEKNYYLSEAKDELVIFYYNCMKKGIDVCDADRYANLNTVMGYDIGFENFQKIDGYLWCEHDIDLMELTGNEESKQTIIDAANHLNISLDFSKWNSEEIKEYVYYVN